MTPLRGIHRPGAGADRPRPWGVVSVFAIGVVVGLLLVRSTVRQPRHAPPVVAPPEAPAAASEWATAAAAEGEGSPPSGATVRAEAEGSALDDASPAVADAAAPAPPAEPARPAGAEPVPSTPGSHRTVLPGRLAYLQCVGLERPDRAFPCPRDPALEAAAWEVLLALPHCPDVDIGAGAADVRLHFGREPAPEVRIRSVPGEPALSPEILRTCAGEALSALRTRLRSSRMVLSLRFRTR